MVLRLKAWESKSPPDLASLALYLFTTYIKGTATGAVLEKLEQKLAAAPSDQKEGVLGDIMEKLRAEGEAYGIVKGRKQSLSRLLERRFGTLPAAVKARIAGADHVTSSMGGSTGCWTPKA